MKRLFFLLLLLFSCAPVLSQVYVGNIYFDRVNVFDSTEAHRFFAYKWMNALHVMTKNYIIEDELLFDIEDEIDPFTLAETERNLRKTGLFSEVKIELDSVSDDEYDVYIVTRERWSTQPSLLLGTGGGESNYGGRLEELNLLGTGTRLSVEGLYRTENNIKWQGAFELAQRRLFRSELGLSMILIANKYRTDQLFTINKPYRTEETEYSFGLNGLNSFGKDFLYNTKDSFNLMSFHERRISAWVSKAWWKQDRVFATIGLEWEDVDRYSPEYRRAFDNSGKFFLAFSSVAREFIKTKKINTYHDEDMPVGGWGTAILGKTFPIGHRGEGLYYIAGQGERSYFSDNIYLFGQITGASGFKRANGVYTYQEFLGLGFYRLSSVFLLAARVREQAVWNWGALRQLILDNDAGLRGYSANDLAGDNRMIANLELRAFPGWELAKLKLSAVAFYDLGSVWRQDTHLKDTRWHNSAGIGIRFHNMTSFGESSIYRFDFAFNFDEKKFAGIIFTTNQLFSAFRNHEFRPPSLFGLEFDYE